VAEHLLITGQSFERISGETDDIYSRWISDYAGKPRQAWWIKAAIFIFSTAVVLLL
jgi:hypothetical protein